VELRRNSTKKVTAATPSPSFFVFLLRCSATKKATATSPSSLVFLLRYSATKKATTFGLLLYFLAMKCCVCFFPKVK
jgi:hypothetical protein